MTYRARCPSCGYKFGRLWFFRVVPEYRHTCPSCGVRLKSNSLWEWVGNFALAIPVLGALVLWLFWDLPGWTVLVVTGATLLGAVVMFPYFTKFDLKEEATDRDS